MPLKLQGSCQCGAVEFTVESHTPVPYQLCACSICRKCGGSGGSVNLGGIASSLRIVRGRDMIREYTAVKDRGTQRQEKCTSQRSFCVNCASMLYLYDPTWPTLIHPFASAIDTDLPIPDEVVCVKGDSKPAWVRWPEGKTIVFDGFNGDVSIDEWHKKKGLWVE